MSRLRALLRPARPLVEAALRWAIVHRPARALFNRIYRRAGGRLTALVYGRTAKLFRGRQVVMPRGSWAVPFAGRVVRVPLRADRMWLDWDQAVSIAGHEPAVKDTYRALLAGRDRPDLFIDVGANYGTHSLIFLVAGVSTLTFEPNDTCHEYFREACALNGVTPDLQPVALGDAPGELDLYFPPDQTWLGTSEPHLIERLRREGRLETRHVRVRTLDEYAGGIRGERVLLKIDAEGHELAILRGATRLLRERRPTVIFEALPDSGRAALADFFSSFGYRVTALPLVAGARMMSREEFLAAADNDFAAVPPERAMGTALPGETVAAGPA